MNRIIAFAMFWMAIGMLLMLGFRYRVMGTLFSLVLLGVSYLLLTCSDDWNEKKLGMAETGNAKNGCFKIEAAVTFLFWLSSFNPAGFQAVCANVHSPCTTVHFAFNASDVGIPDTVGSSMGMAYVVTEMSAFATNIAFCHDCTSSNYIRRLTDNISMIAEFDGFGK